MRFSLAFALFAAFAPAQALAQSAPAFDPAVITTCLADGHGRACIGRGAEACSMSFEGGASTVGWAHCLDVERGWWDDALNRAYQSRMVESRRIDAEPPYPGTLRRPSDVEALRAMQRAWISFRDATCGFEELQWWGGTGASGAHIECLMRLTADQTLYLQSLPGQ